VEQFIIGGGGNGGFLGGGGLPEVAAVFSSSSFPYKEEKGEKVLLLPSLPIPRRTSSYLIFGRLNSVAPAR